MLKKLMATEPRVSSTLLRLGLAIVIFPHGAQKLLGWFGGGGVTGTVDFFRDVLGIPARVCGSVEAACVAALDAGRPVLVTGSIYVAGEARSALR